MPDNTLKIYLDQHSFDIPGDSEATEVKLNSVMPLIGEIALHFNALEATLDGIIATIITERSNDIGYTLLSKMTFSQKVEVFKDLIIPMCSYTDKTSEMTSSLESIVVKLREAAEMRNRALHAHWFEANRELFVRTKVKVDKKGVYGTFVKLNRTTLNQYITKINRTDVKLEILYEKFEKALYMA